MLKIEVSPPENYEQAERLNKLVSAFEGLYGEKPEVVIRVPGTKLFIGFGLKINMKIQIGRKNAQLEIYLKC
jgi:hypothetical protein